MQKLVIECSGEHLITPSGLSLVSQMLGESRFIKKCNNMKVDGKLRDNKGDPKKFLRTPKRKGGFFYDERIKITRKEARKHLVQWNLACELSRTIRHFFPDLVSMLKKLPDPRHQSYITYPGVLLLMTRILSSLFYLSSMRKASEELNSDAIIENLWAICGESPTIDEIPYWETINRYLKKIEPSKLQEIIWQLCRRLIRSRAFAQAKIQGKY